uniref:Uncharacterized protein n=1 Tax=Klebsiella pneumoniae TaxID=573 RepID=A0A8B0SX36_KLEPN|nr:hypothetical protein [Klebsiella pneumoniae]
MLRARIYMFSNKAKPSTCLDFYWYNTFYYFHPLAFQMY